MERRVWLMEKWAGVGNGDILKQAEAGGRFLSMRRCFQVHAQVPGDSQNEMIKGFPASRPFDWTKLTAGFRSSRAWWDGSKSRPLLISGIPPGFRLAEGGRFYLAALGPPATLGRARAADRGSWPVALKEPVNG